MSVSLITPSREVVAMVPRAPMLAISAIISPMLLSEGALLGYEATAALMRTLLACCAACVGVGGWLHGRPGGYSVGDMWWVAALFTLLRLLGNAACVAKETATMEAFAVATGFEMQRRGRSAKGSAGTSSPAGELSQ